MLHQRERRRGNIGFLNCNSDCVVFNAAFFRSLIFLSYLPLYEIISFFRFSTLFQLFRTNKKNQFIKFEFILQLLSNR